MKLKIVYAGQICALLKEDSNLLALPCIKQGVVSESEFVFYKKRQSDYLVLQRFSGVRVPLHPLGEVVESSDLIPFLESGAFALSYKEGSWVLLGSHKIKENIDGFFRTLLLTDFEEKSFASIKEVSAYVAALQDTKV